MALLLTLTTFAGGSGYVEEVGFTQRQTNNYRHALGRSARPS
jgi:hypothetical protein